MGGNTTVLMSSHSPSQTAGYRRDAAAQPQRVGFAEESTGRKNPLRIATLQLLIDIEDPIGFHRGPSVFPIPDHAFFSKSFASVSRSCPSRPTEYRRDAAAQPQRVGFAEESTGRKNPLGLLLSSS